MYSVHACQDRLNHRHSSKHCDQSPGKIVKQIFQKQFLVHFVPWQDWAMILLSLFPLLFSFAQLNNRIVLHLRLNWKRPRKDCCVEYTPNLCWNDDKLTWLLPELIRFRNLICLRCWESNSDDTHWTCLPPGTHAGERIHPGFLCKNKKLLKKGKILLETAHASVSGANLSWVTSSHQNLSKLLSIRAGSSSTTVDNNFRDDRIVNLWAG